ncbi:kinase-like domain-containing protein [Amylocystis lapponica]|nr:kinase-like domain-containing protein [Amylocystis lapponica]
MIVDTAKMADSTALFGLTREDQSYMRSGIMPSTCASVVLATPPLKTKCLIGKIGENSCVVTKPGQTDEQRVTSHESFEVEQVKNIKELVPEWDDDEVDELMVLSPKTTPRMHKETAELPCDPGLKHVISGDFDIACPFPGIEGEAVVTRQKGTQDLYFIKAHVKRLFGNGDGPARKARREREALRMLTKHDVPFTTRLHCSWQDMSAFFLVTTFCPGGDLRTLVEHSGPVCPDEARIYAAEIVGALGSLHELGVVHRDLNPGNVFIGADGHIVLAGFERALFINDDGICISDDPDVVDTQEVRPHQAPEIVLGWVHDCAVDWWGFGVVLFYILTGRYPFCDEDDMDGTHIDLVRSRILHGGLAADQLSSDLDVLDLIWKCLQRNPLFRCDIHNVLAHPYFADVDWEQVQAKELPVPPVPSLHQEIIAAAKEAVTGSSSAIGTSVNDEFFPYVWTPGTSENGEAQISSGHCPEIPEETTGTSGTMDMDLDSGPRTRMQSAASSMPTIQELDGDLSIPAEFGGLPLSDGVVEHKTRFGTLRKYSSLHFDADHKTDTLPSAPSVSRTNSSGASAHLSEKLPQSQSAYTSPLSIGTGSPRTRNKLRKKARPDSTPNSVLIPQSRLVLPEGIEQIGNGIGYTRRVEPTSYARLSLSTLTPRTCHALFTGGVPKHANARSRVGTAAPAGVAVMGSANTSEDQMDAVMHEMYGSAWRLGMSANEVSAAAADPRTYAAEARPGVGLGWGEGAVGLGRGVRRASPPKELATLSPNSTLRLVSPSTPRLEFY